MIYLVHLDEPLGDAERPHMSARHYLGYHDDAATLDERIACHRAGQGASILRAANERGISYDVVATFDGDRNAERRLKKSGHFADRLCPKCMGTAELEVCA